MIKVSEIYEISLVRTSRIDTEEQVQDGPSAYILGYAGLYT